MLESAVLVVPVYNEEAVLARSIGAINEYISKNVKCSCRIVIADNGSTDGTGRVGNDLARELENVDYVSISRKGRGIALKQCWARYEADVYAYCDVDLSSDVSLLNALFSGVLGGNDVVIGNRYMASSETDRSFSRKMLSLAYNRIVRLAFGTRISDFQCGFKAVSSRVVRELVPRVENDGWFFDTELVIRAEREGAYRIVQIPVKWTEYSMDGRKSTVRKLSTIIEYLKDVYGLRRKLARSET